MDQHYGTHGRSIRIILAAAVFLAAGAIGVALWASAKSHKANVPIFTAPPTHTTASSPQLTQYSGTNAGLRFSYPASWKDASDPGSGITTIIYVVDNVTYRFQISPPGQINPEGVDGLTYTTTDVSYDGQPYVRAIWSTNGSPFYITAVPLQNQSSTSYTLSMQLPPADAQQYIAAFDQIASTLRY